MYFRFSAHNSRIDEGIRNSVRDAYIDGRLHRYIGGHVKRLNVEHAPGSGLTLLGG